MLVVLGPKFIIFGYNKILGTERRFQAAERKSRKRTDYPSNQEYKKSTHIYETENALVLSPLNSVLLVLLITITHTLCYAFNSLMYARQYFFLVKI